MKPVKTGIAGLDEFLMGGLPPRIILLTGAPGSGNEVFAKQTLFNRVKTCPVTYFTVNATAESVREDMAAYGWDTVPFEETDAWKFRTLKNTSANELIDIILKEMSEGRSIALDSTSELMLTHKLKDIVNLITAMTHQNRNSENFQMLLVTEGMQEPIADTTMNHYAEGSINFSISWAADATIRQLIIKKMSGTIIPTRRLTYTLGRRGIIIETATRIT